MIEVRSLLTDVPPLPRISRMHYSARRCSQRTAPCTATNEALKSREVSSQAARCSIAETLASSNIPDTCYLASCEK